MKIGRRHILYDPRKVNEDYISERRILRSLLPQIRHFQGDETYEKAKQLMDRMDVLDKEYEQIYQESLVCNRLLARLISSPDVEQQDGSIFEDEEARK